MSKKCKKGVSVILCLVLLFSSVTYVGAAKAKITGKSGKALPKIVYAGQKYNLKVKNAKVKFSSSKKKVATVTATGKLNLKAPGKVTILAKSGKKTVASLKLDVKLRAKSIRATPKTIQLAVGESTTIKASKSPAKSTDVVKMYSSDASVATVGQKNGVLTAKKSGTATITIYSMATNSTKKNDKGNKKCTVTVTVTEASTPSAAPSATPTMQPTTEPTAQPTTEPTKQPTEEPTKGPEYMDPASKDLFPVPEDEITEIQATYIDRTPVSLSPDGKVDVIWANVEAVYPRIFGYTSESQYNGEELPERDYGVEFRVAWTEDAIHVLAVVQKDPDTLSEESSSDWIHDSVEVFLAQNNDREGPYTEYDAQFRVNYLGKKSVETNRFESEVVITSYGYIAQFEIPILDGVTVENDKEMGIELQVNFSDPDNIGARITTLNVFHETAGAWQDTSEFGTLRLVGKPN